MNTTLRNRLAKTAACLALTLCCIATQADLARLRAELVVSTTEEERRRDPAWTHDQANRLFQKGLGLFNGGKLSEGLTSVRQATQLEPHIPDWHMNYGSLLSAKAGLLYKAHKEQEAVLIAKEAEKELRLALDLFTDKQASLQKGQCYFIIGDIAFFIYKDTQAARYYYQESLKNNPDNNEAKEALQACQ